jgi:adenine-specific DNA-methyltransferase
MGNKLLQKLELTWIGKGDEPKLEPRILINNPKYSYGDSRTENMLIHGDNLLALKALEQEYNGKVKCIYIDPPYNTGSAFEHYDDGVEHSIWLSLLRDRLKILHSLLSNEGSIWISIDDNECHYLKILCDEIFGRNNFIANVIWQKRTSPDNRLRLGPAHDYILVYSKTPIAHKLFNQLEVNETRKKDFKNPDNDPRGLWASTDCTAQGGHGTASQFYTLVTPAGREINLPDNLCWRFTKIRMEEEIRAGRIWFGKDGMGVPRKKTYLSEITGQNSWTWWSNSEVGHNQEAKKEINSLFGDKNTFDTPKPERLIARILTIASNKGDIILDSFLGSGTTAAVAHKMGRKYIGIELGEHAKTHCYPRLKQVVTGEQGGISKLVSWQGGGGFKYYTLAPSLLNKDRFGNWIISREFNPTMLAAAMAKQEGFTYQPSEHKYWQQGNSSENDFIFTSTQFLTVEALDSIAAEMQDGQSLLICCKAFQKECKSKFPNISIKKIPQMLLNRCEFNKDDYSLNIINLPTEEEQEETLSEDADAMHSVQEIRDSQENDTPQTSLF